MQIRFPLNTLQTPIVLSPDPDAKYSPFGENTTVYTNVECPVSVSICSSLDILHKQIVLSPDPDAKNSPFGENTTVKT